ncbi:unnamed protein product [Penicillium bialowiezense]
MRWSEAVATGDRQLIRRRRMPWVSFMETIIWRGIAVCNDPEFLILQPDQIRRKGNGHFEGRNRETPDLMGPSLRLLVRVVDYFRSSVQTATQSAYDNAVGERPDRRKPVLVVEVSKTAHEWECESVGSEPATLAER